MSQKNQRETARQNRKGRIRKRIFGTEQRPRLSVFRSAKHIYAQLVIDSTGSTILAASTLSPDLRAEIVGRERGGPHHTQATCVRHRGDERRHRHAAHAGEDDRVLDTEKIADGSAQHAAAAVFLTGHA